MADQLKAKRSQVKSKVTRFKTYLESVEISKDFSQLSHRLEKFKECWTEFETVQDQLELIQPEIDYNQDREMFENSYFELLSKAEAYIKSTHNVIVEDDAIPIQQLGSVHVKLPTINLPVFSGNYEEWLQYSELFISLIHNNSSLSNVQKLFYLKTSLKGQASSVIDSLELTAPNYSLAWDLLTQRFQNKRVIVNKHVSAIFNIPSIGKESSKELRNLLDSVQKHLRALQSLEQPVAQWDTLIIHSITSKLDSNTLKLWESSLVSNELPSFKQLVTFLGHRCQTLEALETTKLAAKSQTSSSCNLKEQSICRKQTTSSSFLETSSKCPVCGSNHNIYQCPEFTSIPAPDRLQKVRKLGLCINCLSKTHKIRDCHSSNCKTCGKKHNTLLHLDSHSNTTVKVNQIDHNPPQTSLASNSQSSFILLSTATIHVSDVHGKKHDCRVLLDSASQSNFITESLVDKLKLPKSKSFTNIIGIGQTHSNVSHDVTCNIFSKCSAYKATINCHVLPKITNDLPYVQVDISQWNIPKSINLADISFNKPGPIDMLIGAELFFNLLCIGQIKPNKQSPILQKTSLGWIVSGKVNRDKNTKQDLQSHCNLSIGSNEHFSLQKFWEIEDYESPKANLTEEEEKCESIYINTTSRDQSGRYTVDLPLKENIGELGDSFEMAMTRFKQIERKIHKDESLFQSYCDFLDEYEALGHMEEVFIEENSSTSDIPKYYIPHLPVIRESSTTTKLRVVFDASAKTSSGLSLNDTLMVGPTIQQDIFTIISRFRLHKYVLTADIEKMYRQIMVNEKQQDLQLILWRKTNTEPIKIKRLKTVTYGTASAPYLAIRTLHQLAIDEKERFPKASSITLTDFYVDDLMTGADSEEDLSIIYTQMTDLLKSGGFKIRKWNSNNINILKCIPTEDRAQFKESQTKPEPVKVLGMIWNSEKDVFKYSIKDTNPSSKITKRIVLSEIAGLYDPLGLLGPIIVKAKLFMQDLWQQNLEWDESLPSILHSSWQVYRQELHILNELELPRLVKGSQSCQIELHGFCDSSERAYGACIYLRTTDSDSQVHVNLLCSKIRVSPLKKTTIPRLELCGALLLAKLLKKVINVNIKCDSCSLWSDSTIVLVCIKSPSKTWKTFVANRVHEIHSLTNGTASWKHVRTDSNPADFVSRGLKPEQILNCKQWWHGPAWLTSPQSDWPQSNCFETTDVPEKWATGRVLEVHPGLDGSVRVVTVKTAAGIMKRAANKMCVLPIEQ